MSVHCQPPEPTATPHSSPRLACTSGTPVIRFPSVALSRPSCVLASSTVYATQDPQISGGLAIPTELDTLIALLTVVTVDVAGDDRIGFS